MNSEAVIKCRSGQQIVGTWLSIGSPVIAELAAQSGLDWLLFDLEHGCGSESGLLANLQALRGSRALGIVRVGAPHPDLVMRALDWGADGIMFPHVNSSEEAEACVQAVHYPPRGRRGYSRSVRAYDYGLHPPDESTLMTAPLVMVQIETLEGVDHAASIAKTDGVDVLFVGPADLNFDLKVRNGEANKEYESCLRRVNAAARAAGKATGILIRDPSETYALCKIGFATIAVESDLSILRAGFQRLRP